ncbi:MAG: hypothetical protein ACRDT8_00225 [Micromonosporaceae bacterium]
MPYAVANDLLTVLDAVPADAERRIRRAELDINRILLTARYDPAGADVIAALKEATCEQVAYGFESGDTGTGAAGQFQSVAIGSVQLARGATGGAAETGGIAPKAFDVLQQAGLTGHSLVETVGVDFTDL